MSKESSAMSTAALPEVVWACQSWWCFSFAGRQSGATRSFPLKLDLPYSSLIY